MIDGKLYKEMIISGANLIDNRKENVNKLNVFPVPDGDTGINMSLTMQAGKREIENYNGSLSECASKVASAVLRGGRGNSGVILSLFFRGVSKNFSGKSIVTLTELADAFQNGVASAYKAVKKPTEGTILTVMREMAQKAVEIAPGYDRKKDIAGFFTALLEQCRETLNNTPELLPILKQANVVDAGGMGFTYIIEGMTNVACKKGIVPSEQTQSDERRDAAEFKGFNNEEIKFSYCTECIVEKGSNCTGKMVEILNSYINGVGDSVVFLDDDSIVKFHVHTNDPGKVISEALKCGSLSMVKVENMRNQHSELINKEERKNEVAKPEKKYGFVSVVAGSGLISIFKDLGVDNIVEGGQTMNPSTDDIVNAINRTPSEIVFVLPNNSNIYLAAKQAEKIIEEKKVIVLKTHSIPQGISSMVAFNPDADENENLTAMKEAIANVKTARVTFAARDTVFDGQEIKQNQILGLIENEVKFIENDKITCIKEISEELKNNNYINVFSGSDADPEESEKVVETMKEILGDDVEVSLLEGGQPIYYYIISAENI